MSAYIKFAAIKKGESLAEGHKGSDGWIEVGSVSFGSGRSISTPTGAAAKIASIFSSNSANRSEPGQPRSEKVFSQVRRNPA